MLADIEESSADAAVPRVLPVADARVDGVIVLIDGASRIVRISIDIAGRTAPKVQATADASHLVLSFIDASRAPASAISFSGDQDRFSRGSAASGDSSHGAEATDPGAAAAQRVQARARREMVSAPATPPLEHSPTLRASTTAAAPADSASGQAAPVLVRSVVQKPVVVLDPGHGGKDPGAQAWTGEYEKDIVLDVAERVARRLRASGDVDVVMTRSGDEFVELADRRDTSRRWNADVFVSIHANASKSASARGFETYYRTRSLDAPAAKTTGDREIRRLARLENDGKGARRAEAAGASPNPTGASPNRAGVSPNRAGVSHALLHASTLPVADHDAESLRLATLVQSELVRQLDLRYEAVRDLGAREGPFFVIGNNAAPSVLVEAAFLTHREEGLRMRSEVYREQIADVVARGIRLYLDEQRRAGTL